MTITGSINEFNPKVIKIGTPVVVTVKYTVHLTGPEIWQSGVKVSDGTDTFETPRRNGFNWGDQVFEEVVDMGYPMPEEPIVITYQLFGSTDVLPGVAMQALTQVYSQTIKPTTKDQPNPLDIAGFLEEYGIYIAGGALVLGLGAWAMKSRQ